MKNIYLFIIYLFFSNILYSQIKFEPISIDNDNNYLFNSIEKVGENEVTKTLFYGNLIGDITQFESLSFYPENFYLSKNLSKLQIQNRIGLYEYDIEKNIVNPISIYPSFTKKDEFVIHRLQKASISSNNKYIVGKMPVSPTKSNIYLYDISQKEYYEIVKDVETTPGSQSALWASDSNYFIYQKNNNIYYFSVNDYKNKKLLSEEWRWVGKVNLKNAYWANDNYLIWIEDNIIYKADPNQFFYRSIYKTYLRQGEIIGKIPFQIDQAFDSFVYNDFSKKFVIVKDGASIFYYSLSNDLKQNPYIQLQDNMRFDNCVLFNSGEGILTVNLLTDGKLTKKLFILKKVNNEFQFIEFQDNLIKDSIIYGFSTSLDENQFVVNTSKGAFCYNFENLSLLWKHEKEKIVQSINVGNNQWIIGGNYTTYKVDSSINLFQPIFASSIQNVGFYKDSQIGIILNENSYIIDKNTKTLKEQLLFKDDLIKNEKNQRFRVLSREIKKGFYKDGVYLKDLYSGVQIEVTGLPKLRYKLYQPELKVDNNYFYTPLPDKYEIGMIFDCIKTAEGVFPILTNLDQFKITSTFFINGNFTDINPTITKEISNFNVEVGNMFQYYINLTQNAFLIDKNFIRQGLSSNEEKYYNITKKNFSPYWHTPMFAFSETILKYGLESGYKFVTFNLDSLDWVSQNLKELDSSYYMNNAQLIDRILSKIKPGQTILFNVGKNNTKRDDFLFNDIDLLISELVRAGYSFTSASDLMQKYRE
ncbi:MAG: hypothetical protein A2Z98_09705 [Spirochaetes bacterium GWB1_27_13]|nr:MAG: hypothetical protein A2Z98_09705 [Spirochaetes bacterium GWB1_27_13]